MARLKCSQKVKDKIRWKHNVECHEVIEAFGNREGKYVEDDRETHKTLPPTQWFIAETDHGRRLKVVFIQYGDVIELKTAYAPNMMEEALYERKCRERS